ncbi:CpaF/VirB11 family protein [Erysipelothrix rhusiopathiae]|nr:CpaF/VirB11 family protein [Erysipelothrix rhusiopathiae]UPU40277.1 CpaF/VirB11 family protein [Erysipelothrix sp. Poltava]AWU40858.1 CpaF family protein [Erysipelothrix rhusiopathiae]MDE8033142.1 CpaF/VirB11 family protein [Erysipelothrix rhusiopathiae]MDE8037196.1 CpaF/VirB11 family protein [Erysipelothrix rhusiopathiae]MDE8037611.1 CpaF/VirB11 family protein [Erysipelothrix rhusiopathiae]
MLTTFFDFGPLTPFVEDENITDINFNGVDLWIDDLVRGRLVHRNFSSHEIMWRICSRLSNIVNLPFNQQHPVLETDLNELRISVIHPSVTRFLSVSIRKTTFKLRLSETYIESSSYMSISALKFLKYAVRSKCNILVSGLPGAGKTELIKFLAGYISRDERIITIEDSYELHLKQIYPPLDTVEIKVDERFNYSQAIKASLRQRPNWLLLSEVRGSEIVDLLRCISTGASVMSTVHARSAMEIPDRIQQMTPINATEHINEQKISDAINIGIHIDLKISSGGIQRYVREIVVFTREGHYRLYTFKGKRLQTKIPELIKEKAELYGVKW